MPDNVLAPTEQNTKDTKGKREGEERTLENVNDFSMDYGKTDADWL